MAKQTPETLVSIFQYLFGTDAMSPTTISWPPDAFCFAATVLQKYSSYTSFIGDGKPTINFKHSERHREAALEVIGEKWREAAGKGAAPPTIVREWFNYIRKHKKFPIRELVRKKRLLAALINLLAAADESCFGLGISLTSSDNDAFTKIAELQLFPRDIGSSLCKHIHPSRARVLPKSHTPQTGLTIRSFSNFLALIPSNEVCPEWYSFCADTSAHALNLLLIPWPMRITPKQFRATRKEKISDEVDRGGYGLFTFDSADSPRIDHVKRLIKHAEKTIGRIDGVVLPELALSQRIAKRMSSALVREDCFFITGVGKAASKKECGENYINFDVMLPGGEYIASLYQANITGGNSKRIRYFNMVSEQHYIQALIGGSTSK